MEQITFPLEFAGEVFTNQTDFLEYLQTVVNGSDFASYQKSAAGTAIYPTQIATDQFGLVYTILGLNGEAGELAEQVKKMFRDDDGILTDERREKMEKEAGDVLWYLSEFTRQLGLGLDSVAILNLLKLSLRMQENKISGEGSNR